MLEKVVVLDCNGVLIIDKGAPRIEELEVPLGVVDGLNQLTREGFRFLIMTNIPEWGQRKYTDEMVNGYIDAFSEYFNDFDIAFEVFGLCPHPPRLGCSCRKPKQAMLRTTEDDLLGPIDWESAYGIGIHPSHSEMMLGIGGYACLIESGLRYNTQGIRYWRDDDHEVRKLLSHSRHSQYLCVDFSEAVEWILETEAVRNIC